MSVNPQDRSAPNDEIIERRCISRPKQVTPEVGIERLSTWRMVSGYHNRLPASSVQFCFKPEPRPGDTVQPDVIPKSKAKHRGGLGGATRVFLGLAAVLGSAALATSKSGSTTSYNNTARATQIGPSGTNAAAVQITWTRPHQVTSNQVIQYQVYRVDPTNASIPILIAWLRLAASASTRR